MTLPTTSDLCDRFGDQVQVCRAPLKLYGARRSAAGRIVCLRCFEDAALLRSRLEQPGDGGILVVDGGASQRVAVFGENMARLGIKNGWTGVVINGAVRDVEKLKSMDFAILALGHTPVRGGRSGLGERDVELAFGEVVFTPGLFICVDSDGLVLLPQGSFAPPWRVPARTVSAASPEQVGLVRFP